ncbi:hypothetical protein [Tepidibacter formicigenes]|jgi:hypothetical protein|uniref:Cytotoxic n=1 Tax=Tepidibacter formicigenes DSM 15518 TaxID=1123349 RepID=A0A1M6U7W6_9FIRM|nr:hypothetical protein [Tepidibacter formicigenes]SHK65259.1 hypothetical protein SAMN02744037_02750 [Tepidibacter formicigenes DSM 15518]
MKKLTRKIISFILMILMISNISISAFASETESSSKNTNINKCNIVITDDGVYINDVYYTQEQFVKLLNTAVEVDITELKNDTIKNNSVMRSVGVQSATGALIAGTWWIPGVGEVVITAAGAVIIGGTVIAAGTWLYNKVVDWFEARAEIKAVKQKIPERLKNKKGKVDLGKFNQKVKGDKVAYKEKGGWTIEKDTAQHGGRKWKLKDKRGRRVASLDENGKVLGK